MFLNNVSIKNFGCIESMDTSFGKTNIIMGKNGSGKSKFLSTIVYSLCNSLDYKIENYIRTGQSKFEIDLDWSHLGNNYRIQLEGSKSGSDKLLTVNGTDEYKNNAMLDYIEKYIHKPKLTLASSITMQGTGSDILFEPNQKRVERLKQIFGIDRLNEVGLHIKTQIDELKGKIKELETENKTLDSTEYPYKEVGEAPDEKKLLETKAKKLQLEKEKVEYDFHLSSYSTYIQQLYKYEEALKEIAKLNVYIEGNNQKIVSLESSKVEVDPNKIDKLNIEIETLRNDNLVIRENLNKLIQLEEIKVKIENIQNKNNELVVGLLPRKVEIPESIQQDIIKLSTEIAIMESKRDLVEKGKCHTCGQDYKEFTDIVEFDARLHELTNDKAKLENQLSSLKQAKEQYDNIKSNNEKVELNKKLLQDQLDVLEIELNQFQDVQDLNKEVLQKNLKNNNDTYIIYNEDIKSIQTNIESNNTIIDSIKTVLNENKIFENNISTLASILKPEEVKNPVEFNTQHYDKIVAEVNSQEDLMQNYNSIIDYNKMLKELERNNLIKIQDNQKLLDGYRNSSKLKDQTKKIIEKDFSSWLIDKGSTFIKTKMNEFFQKSYGKFIIDLKNEDKTVDFYYTEDQENYLNVAMASGYEKDVISAAFRLALSSMQNVGLMLLDEIDSFSDEENSLRLYRSLMEEDLEQMLIISHYSRTQEFLIQNGAKIIELN